MILKRFFGSRPILDRNLIHLFVLAMQGRLRRVMNRILSDISMALRKAPSRDCPPSITT